MARPLLWVALATVAAFGALSGYREIFGPDVGFHLASGRWLVENLRWPDGDPFTWTVPQNRYVDMQWLFQLALGFAFRAGGSLGAVLFNILLTLLSAGLLAWRCARREGGLDAPVAPLLLLFLSGNLWEIRPHAASWLLLNVVLLVLEEHARGRSRALWTLPLAMLVWVNTHSLFVLGVAAIAIHAAASWLKHRSPDRRLLAWGGAAVIACLLNPYGVSGLLYPLRQLGEIHRASAFSSETSGIAEFLSPFSGQAYAANGAFVLLQPLLFIHLYMIATAFALHAAPRRLRAEDWLLLTAFGYLFGQAQKNFGYFVVATLPAVAAGWNAVGQRLRGGLRARSIATAGTLLVCAVLGLQTLSGWRYAQERLPFRLGHDFSEEFLPVRASEFLKERVPPGRLLNSWDDGGYVHFATGRPVFVDARSEVMGEEFFQSYLRLKDPATLPAELARWDPQIALVPFNFMPSWLVYFERNPEWRCVYADEQDLIYVRRSFAPSLPELDAPRAGADHPPVPAAEADAILERALRLEEPSFSETFLGPHHYPLRELRRTALHLSRNQPAAALAHGLRGLARATIPSESLVNNVMLGFIGTGDLPRAARCYQALPASLRDGRMAKLLGSHLQPGRDAIDPP